MIEDLGPRFRYQVLENVLDLGPISQIYDTRYWKRYQVQVLRPRIRFQVLEKDPRIRFHVLDLSQIQVLCPRISTQVLENVLDLGSRTQIQVLGPRKCLRFRSYFLGLCTRYWKRTRIRCYVLELVLGLVPKFQEISQIQVLGPKFRSQVIEILLDLGPTAWKWSQNQDLSPRKGPRFRYLGPRFRYQVLENVLDLVPKFLGNYARFRSSKRDLEFRSQVLENGPRFRS